MHIKMVVLGVIIKINGIGMKLKFNNRQNKTTFHRLFKSINPPPSDLVFDSDRADDFIILKRNAFMESHT